MQEYLLCTAEQIMPILVAGDVHAAYSEMGQTGAKKGEFNSESNDCRGRGGCTKVVNTKRHCERFTHLRSDKVVKSA
jgi:hypothetical protein